MEDVVQQHGLHLIPKDLVYVGLQQGTPRFFQDRKLSIDLLVQLLVFAFDAAFLALGKVKTFLYLLQFLDVSQLAVGYHSA